MHFQFLVEDQSCGILIDKIMNCIIEDDNVDSYDCKCFKGLGGFTKKNTVKETHTGKLLNDLATYLRGFQRSLQGLDAIQVIVLDNDDHDPGIFLKELEEVAKKNSISMDHLFCLAVEEVEAWLLGDEMAIQKAYPAYKKNVLHSYEQDEICGTWELLADVIFKGGIREIRRRKMSYMEIGKLKSEWADRIGEYMDFSENKSPSFRGFYEEINRRVYKVA